MRLNCAIFDMDGTVLDSMQAWVDAIGHILTRRGITPPADLREITRPMNGMLLVDYLQREFLPGITGREITDEVGAYMEDFYSNRV